MRVCTCVCVHVCVCACVCVCVHVCMCACVWMHHVVMPSSIYTSGCMCKSFCKFLVVVRTCCRALTRKYIQLALAGMQPSLGCY